MSPPDVAAEADASSRADCRRLGPQNETTGANEQQASRPELDRCLLFAQSSSAMRTRLMEPGRRGSTTAEFSAYRSEIFYASDEQRQVAEDTIADVDASGLWPGKVVIEISEAVPFWEAEPEHQDYLQRYPNGYTCHFPRPGWKLPHRETAA